MIDYKVDFGKHKGKLFSELPTGYLKWMVSVNHEEAVMAASVLEERGESVLDIEPPNSGPEPDYAENGSDWFNSWVGDEW